MVFLGILSVFFYGKISMFNVKGSKHWIIYMWVRKDGSTQGSSCVAVRRQFI